jgi:hypothetical protein
VVVVSEENGQISLVERARIVRNLNEAQLARAIRRLLSPGGGRTLFGLRTTAGFERRPGGRAPRLADLGRLVGRNGSRRGEPRPADRVPDRPPVERPPAERPPSDRAGDDEPAAAAQAQR